LETQCLQKLHLEQDLAVASGFCGVENLERAQQKDLLSQQSTKELTWSNITANIQETIIS
jgi:hypothetical protein